MLIKFALSMGSFIPLHILMFIMYIYQIMCNDLDNITKYFIVGIIIIIILIIFICCQITKYFINTKLSNNISNNEIELTKIQPDKKVYIDYMVTYLLPLFSLNMEMDIFNLIFTNILILTLICINAKAENFNLNIVLMLKKYEIFTGETKCGDIKCILMKKEDFSNLDYNNKCYRFVNLKGNIYIFKRYIKNDY